ncbi:MAG: DNA cytosine methyltransferase [Metamycoplasma hominis]|jgi:hypothetical protein|nr:DNA cytosine methyltransferase [Metamycoplasma hominis]
MEDKKLTYISLFSSAGVGCFGFKEQGFECIATNEIIERRLEIQKYNNKCKYETGYICGDITKNTTTEKILNEVNFWKNKEHIKNVDVIIATPPCQGMSVANHKKKDNEINRNSLVVESIKMINLIQPNFFVFENVPAFMKTLCTDVDGNDKSIAEAIKANLGDKYEYIDKIINFKNYGASSSRTRTIVIGVSKKLVDQVSPLDLFPSFKKEKTLRETIGDLKSLNVMGEICKDDFYHFFRSYPEHMRSWIHDLKEGESAFDNEDDLKKPHQIIDGKIKINARKNSDKYTRTYWDKVGSCVHTRNDQLASQNTIHPKDDRVFSIRELMKMMTVPKNFKWCEYSLDELNKMTDSNKRKVLKKEEIVIRQSLGEAVPTAIFSSIAKNIKNMFDNNLIGLKKIKELIEKFNLNNSKKLSDFIEKNPLNLSIVTLGKIAELANGMRTEEAAFFTDHFLVAKIVESLPNFEKEELRILEPSCGVGNFIPQLIKKYSGIKLDIDLVDIDSNSINIAKKLLAKLDLADNVKINYIVSDFLEFKISGKYDLIIGNPPFIKYKGKKLKENIINQNTSNTSSFFFDKSLLNSTFVALVMPKFLLNTPEFSSTREYLKKLNINSIIDFGEYGFKGVLIETIAILVDTTRKPNKTIVYSMPKQIELLQSQKYITDDKFPYWIIYRNDVFDKVAEKLEFNVFTVFRDRQITNSILHEIGDIKIIRSRNISDDGSQLISIDGYDKYIYKNQLSMLAISKYLNADNVYLSPNMTYYPRMMKKPKDLLANGSVAILIPKKNIELTEEQLKYFSSKEYRNFYKIARNYQTRSLNIDSLSVYFFGVLK